MVNVQFPETVSGQWIYLERLKGKQDATVLFRHSFFWNSDTDDEAVFLVSANTSYRLFVNGRFAGCGPRIHQTPGTSYIDAHEIGFCLEPGNNQVALYVYNYSDDCCGESSRVPGMWCQLQCGTKTLLSSDASWEIMSLDGINQPRAKVAGNGRLSTFTDLRLLPPMWNTGGENGRWERPDVLALPGFAGGLIELHPVSPAVVGADPVGFEPLCRGRIAQSPVISNCSFSRTAAGKTAAAVSYVFSDEKKFFSVKFFSDDPCRFFCNRKKLFDGPCARGEEILIPLEKGLNRLVVFSKVRPGGMGFMFLNSDWPGELLFLSDMLDSAEPGWCVGTVSRLKYEDCTSAVRIENLPDLTVVPASSCCISDIWDWLDNAEFAVSGAQEGWLAEGEAVLFTLPNMCYGNVRFTLTAGEGDIIDLIFGTETDGERIFPRSANGCDREVVSCICCEGENLITNLMPVDCRCVLVYVRRTERGVMITSSFFDELSRNFNRECTFNCSSPFWNQVWQNGKDALLRSSVALVPSDGAPRHNQYMMDSFFESANVASVFGDSSYVTARLRQFAGRQLENGALVSLSAGEKYESSLIHMFFFPGWISANYRFTGNMVELRSLMPKLDAARKYLMSLLDEEKFLLDLEEVGPYEGSETDPVVTCRLPVVLNALLCRFMISASEIYDLAERAFDARECRHLVRKVSAAMLRNFFDEEVGLFSDYSLADDPSNVSFSLLGNFFPLLAGLKTEECFEKFVNTFFEFETAVPRTAEAESPYFHYLFTEMLFALRQKEWGFRYLENYWKLRMAPDGKSWKDPISGCIKISRFADGNTLVPNTFIQKEIVGIRAAEPAHSLIYLDPAYDFVDHAEAAVQTAFGRVHISWKKQSDGGLAINIYSSHPLKVMPEFPEDLLKKSLFCLSENVTLVRSVVKES